MGGDCCTTYFDSTTMTNFNLGRRRIHFASRRTPLFAITFFAIIAYPIATKRELAIGPASIRFSVAVGISVVAFFCWVDITISAIVTSCGVKGARDIIACEVTSIETW